MQATIDNPLHVRLERAEQNSTLMITLNCPKCRERGSLQRVQTGGLGSVQYRVYHPRPAGSPRYCNIPWSHPKWEELHELYQEHRGA